MGQTIYELRADIERELADNEQRETTLTSEIEAIVESARADGRTHLTSAEDMRCELLYKDIQHAQAAHKRIESRLARAREVEAEEIETEKRLETRIQNPVTAKLSVNERVESVESGRVTSADSPQWTYRDNGRPAVVTGNWQDNAFVREDAARNAERDRLITGTYGDFGHYVRAMSTTGASAVIPTEWSNQIIAKARNKAVVWPMCSTVAMRAKTEQIARLTGDIAPMWKNEGSPVTASDVTYDYIQLVAKTISALCVYSLEYVQDAIGSDQAIMDSMSAALALKVDEAILYGQLAAGNEPQAGQLPAPSPKGVLASLLSDAATSVLGGQANGTTQTSATFWRELQQLVYTPIANNESVTGIVSNDKLREMYVDAYDTTGQPLRVPDNLAAIPWRTTNMIGSFTSGTMTSVATDVFAGSWDQVLVGSRMSLEMRTLTERYIENGQLGVIAFGRFDVALARPRAMAVYRYLKGAA